MNLASCGALVRRPLSGTWYRAIQPQHWRTSLQTSQTRAIPSRFSAGPTAIPPFEVLYLAENQMLALFEAQAVFGSPTTPGGVVANPARPWVAINVTVQLRDVVDLSELAAQTLLATTAQELTGDWRGYAQRSPVTTVSQPTGTAPTQELGQALFAEPALEGFLVLSAKLPYYQNLVVFPEKLGNGSRVEFRDPSSGRRWVIDQAGGRDPASP